MFVGALSEIHDDLPKGYDPILAAFPVNLKLAASKAQVVKGDPIEFAHADARGVKDLEYGAVTKAEGELGVGLREKPADLLAAEDIARNLVIEPRELQLHHDRTLTRLLRDAPVRPGL